MYVTTFLYYSLTCKWFCYRAAYHCRHGLHSYTNSATKQCRITCGIYLLLVHMVYKSILPIREEFIIILIIIISFIISYNNSYIEFPHYITTLIHTHLLIIIIHPIQSYQGTFIVLIFVETISKVN